MSPVFLALDTVDLTRAVGLAEATREFVGGFKVGLELFGAHGPDGVRRIAEFGRPVFLDLKLHDIPNTVGQAVAALAPLSPALLTVHAAGGEVMMAAAKAAAPVGTAVVAVTMLTSLDHDDLRATGVVDDPDAHVARLATLTRRAGLDGLVCAGVEVAARRAAWPDGVLVVPGLRPDGDGADDQKRTVSPQRALSDGATVLVIGRPITAAADPAAAARTIAASLELV